MGREFSLTITDAKRPAMGKVSAVVPQFGNPAANVTEDGENLR
jgi:hypothetical protein